MMIQFKWGQIANSFYENHQIVWWDPSLAQALIQICQDLFFHRELLKGFKFRESQSLLDKKIWLVDFLDQKTPSD